MYALIVLAILIFITVFAVQNAAPIAISLLLWSFEASVAVVILISVIAGLLAGIFLMVAFKMKRSLKSDK